MSAPSLRIQAAAVNQMDDSTGSHLSQDIILGRDLLFTPDYFPLIEGKRIAIMANQTSRATVDRLIDDKRTSLIVIFSPEHGFSGADAAGLHVSDSVYRSIPVFGCYGGGDATRRIPLSLLKNIDVLLFEVQDTGARHYTFISSMYLAMDSAADASIKFVVLDRPNPANGCVIEGPVLEKEFQSFVGVGRIPVRHAMTMGELANLFRNESVIMHGPRYPREKETDEYWNVGTLDLVTIPMKHYEREKSWDDIYGPGKWIPTSPNIPGALEAMMYSGTGILGANTLCEMVPGFRKFCAISLPFVSTGEKLLAFIDAAKSVYDFPGMLLSPALNPETREENVIVLEVVDISICRPVASTLALLYVQRLLYPDAQFFTTSEAPGIFDKMTGASWVREELMGKPLPPFYFMLERMRREEAAFENVRKKYLVY